MGVSRRAGLLKGLSLPLLFLISTFISLNNASPHDIPTKTFLLPPHPTMEEEEPSTAAATTTSTSTTNTGGLDEEQRGERPFSPPKPSNRRAERISILLEWFQSQRIRHEPVDVRQGRGDGLGLYASRDVATGEELFSVPSDAILRPEVPGASCEGLSSYGALALRLLWEVHRGSTSPFAGYLQTLPTRHELKMPLLWEEKEVQLLAGSDGPSMRQWQDAVVEEGRRAMEIAQEMGGGMSFTMDTWLWAFAIVMSRSSCLNREDGTNLAIVPLMDLTNHHDDECLYPVICTDPDGCLHFLASRDYGSGQQVYDSYGPNLSPSNKLFTFGYIDELRAPSGCSQGLPRHGSSFISFSCLGDEKDEAVRRLRARALRAAGLSEHEQFEIRVRVCCRREGGSDEGSSSSDGAPCDGDGGGGGEAGDGAVQLEPVIDNTEELDRLLLYLRVSLVDASWLEGGGDVDEDGNEGDGSSGSNYLNGIVHLFRRPHDRPPPEKALEERVRAVGQKECRRRAKAVMKRLEKCWRRQAKVVLTAGHADMHGHRRRDHYHHDEDAGDGRGALAARERLRLTELWLQGERLALQSLYTQLGGEGEVAGGV